MSPESIHTVRTADSAVTELVEWRNWGGNQTAFPARTVTPSDEAGTVSAVRSAVKSGQGLRVVGAGHSFSPLVPTRGVLLDLQHLAGITETDTARRRVRARAGTPISQFGDHLWSNGLALNNQGDIDKQTIAGAIATATHGSGINLGSFSSSLRWVRLIDGRGEIVEIGESDIRELRAAQVALGTLGVFLEVELEVSDRYHLAEQITYPQWDETVASWSHDVDSNRHYSFLWCQHDESAGLYELPVPKGFSMVNRSYTKRYNRVDLDESKDLGSVEGARRDRSYRIYPGSFGIPFHELEYFVPAEFGLPAVLAVQQLIRTKHPDQKYPLEVRWVRRESAYLSPMYERDATVLSVSGEPGTNYMPYLRDIDSLLQDYKARAHWGKIHFLNRERVEALYPEFAAFTKLRQEFDPNGIFLNDHTRELLG